MSFIRLALVLLAALAIAAAGSLPAAAFRQPQAPSYKGSLDHKAQPELQSSGEGQQQGQQSAGDPGASQSSGDDGRRQTNAGDETPTGGQGDTGRHQTNAGDAAPPQSTSGGGATSGGGRHQGLAGDSGPAGGGSQTGAGAGTGAATGQGPKLFGSQEGQEAFGAYAQQGQPQTPDFIKNGIVPEGMEDQFLYQHGLVRDENGNWVKEVVLIEDPSTAQAWEKVRYDESFTPEGVGTTTTVFGDGTTMIVTTPYQNDVKVLQGETNFENTLWLDPQGNPIFSRQESYDPLTKTWTVIDQQGHQQTPWNLWDDGVKNLSPEVQETMQNHSGLSSMINPYDISDLFSRPEGAK